MYATRLDLPTLNELQLMCLIILIAETLPLLVDSWLSQFYVLYFIKPIIGNNGSSIYYLSLWLVRKRLMASYQCTYCWITDYMLCFCRYPKSIQIFEEIARHSLNNNLLKYGVKGHLLNAGICQLCKGDPVAISNALEKYEVLTLGLGIFMYPLIFQKSNTVVFYRSWIQLSQEQGSIDS